MGRTGQSENTQANQQMRQIQADQVARANKATDTYNKDLGALKAQGNPYTAAPYKQTEKLLAGEGAGAANSAGREAVSNEVGATGTNAASAPYYRAMMEKNAARSGAQALVGQNASDTQNADAYSRWLVGADLAPAGVDTSMFGTATSGRDAALGNLTQLGLASYGPMQSLIGAAGAVGGVAAGKIPCWIAAELYDGFYGRKTSLVRFWLNQKWAKQGLIGSVVMALYRRFGRSVATLVRKSPLVRSAFRPMFDLAFNQAIRSALRG